MSLQASLWRFGLGFCTLMLFSASIHAQPDPSPKLERIATGLLNPRGVAVLPDGRLLLAEAGTGRVTANPQDNSGRLSLLTDHNNDGDFDDDGERIAILDQLPGYNILYQFNPGRDEIVGLGDVLLLPDGRALYTLDDHFERLSVGVLDAQQQPAPDLYQTTASTLNAIAYDPQREMLYIAQSSLNAVSRLTLDGEISLLHNFGLLAQNQQAVPAGLAIDPQTGDVLVALFSGQLWDYYGEILSFMPGAAKIVRIDPHTGAATDEIIGLTTAVDVAIDERGNRYVLEMTTEWAAPTLSHTFDLYSPQAPPDAGGYARFSGRVSLYPADSSAPVILADRLDAPTNLTYHARTLYISVGQGTPFRPIWAHGEPRQILGELYRIQLGD